MKKNIIILFPTVAELLLYASGVPIQQNRGNSVASHSASSYIYPMDSSPAQRSDLDHVLNVLHPRASGRNLLNPESQASSNAPTSSASHGARGSANNLPTQNFILPPPSQALPPQSPAPNSHQQHPQKSTSPSPNIPTQFEFVPYIPPVHVSKPAYTTPRDNHQSASSAPVSMDPDRVPKHIPEGLDNLRPNKVADNLEKMTSKMRTPDEVVEEMLVMKTLFEQWLEHNWQGGLITNELDAWKKKAMDLANDERVTEPKSEGLEWWKKMIDIQMKAIAKLYEGQGLQPKCDGYWIDDKGSFTTRLLEERDVIRDLGVMHLMKNSLPTRDFRTLERTDNTSEALLEMAQRQVVSSPLKEEHINGALVLRRKAIQMWMLEGMTKEEFAKQKGILREIVANLDERNFNKVRAEMVIISLQRFIKAERIKWKDA